MTMRLPSIHCRPKGITLAVHYERMDTWIPRTLSCCQSFGPRIILEVTGPLSRQRGRQSSSTIGVKGVQSSAKLGDEFISD
jgi:hypothetical protein